MSNVIQMFPSAIAGNGCKAKDYAEFFSLIDGILINSQDTLKHIIVNIEKLLPCDIPVNSEIVPVHDKLSTYLPKLIEFKSIDVSRSYLDILVTSLRRLKATLYNHAALEISCGNLESKYPDLVSSFYNNYPYFCLEKTLASIIALNAELFHLEIKLSATALSADYGKFLK
jgi:hypothetical protein